MNNELKQNMRKPRCDSRWHRLSSQQRQVAEKWLFEEHLGYTEVVRRLKAEFGLTTSRACICRHYRRRAKERPIAELVEAQAMFDTVTAPISSTEALRTATMKLIAKTTLKLAFERPDQLKELESLARVLLLSENNDIRRERLELKQGLVLCEAAARLGFPPQSSQTTDAQQPKSGV